MVHRIDGTSAAVALPAAGAVVGTPGYFSEGNPGTGTPATVVSQAWANMVQEELVGIAVAAGLTPTKGSNGQIAAALFPSKLFAPNGYQRLPSGLIIQWANLTVPTATGVVWTFPIAFPTTSLCVQATGLANAGNGNENVYVVSNSAVDAAFDSSPGANVVFAFALALGY